MAWAKHSGAQIERIWARQVGRPQGTEVVSRAERSSWEAWYESSPLPLYSEVVPLHLPLPKEPTRSLAREQPFLAFSLPLSLGSYSQSSSKNPLSSCPVISSSIRGREDSPLLPPSSLLDMKH